MNSPAIRMETASNATEIAAELRRQISSGGYDTNERLPPERILAVQFGVARGTVRQALQHLEDARFVARKPGSGTYVTWSGNEITRPISDRTRPLDLVDARFAVEPQMCRLAVLHATGAELEELREYLGRMDACENDTAAFADTDEAFHLALARCTQNPMINWMMLKIHETRTHEQWARMRQLTLNPGVIRTYNIQHREVVEAISERSPERAAEAMKRHLATARRTLVELTD